MKSLNINEKNLVAAWVLCIFCWANTALVMSFSPFTFLEVSALCFAVVVTQLTIYWTKKVGENNPMVASVYKNLIGD
ncbi:hypothetical protein L1077_24105 [Pseudoalteromonas luteoviolacea]|uniref:hypothetical protein n=1 Tax=Pseudoalteromonas luteoviolacea TaxID=43657 RepID=UPI001F4027A3|nr:hypothetical protein [Pseudoalteromonas luteoviolacea]MCF6442516.1 hypothetical protein [Pseudoalteromonas luteoviolacea]